MSGLLQLLARALPDLQVRAAEPLEGPWLASADGAPAFRLRSVAGRPCLWHADRVADVAADLDGAEPLLNRVEAVTGWRLEPAELRQDPHASVVAVGDGATVVELAVDPAAPAPATLVAAAAAAPRDPALPVPRTILATGPLISIEKLASLEVGDLVLLPDTMPAALAGVDAPACIIRLGPGLLLPSRWEQSQPAAFGAPLRVALPDVLLSDETLQALAEHGQIAIGPVPDGELVHLSVGGRELGAGRLTRIGEAIAVQVVTLSTEEPVVP